MKTTKEMYDALTGPFQTNNPSRKLALKNKLRDIKMTKADTIATYFMKITQTGISSYLLEKKLMIVSLSH